VIVQLRIDSFDSLLTVCTAFHFGRR